MSELIVVSFDHLEDARQALAAVRTLEHAGQVHLEDSAIIERDADGVAHVRNELSGATETGAVIGAVIGGFVAFAFPPAGIAIGAALGGAIGALMHTGVEGSFVKDVEKQLTPGKSALFLVAKEAHMDALVGALRPFKGELIQTTLEGDAEDSIKHALD
jgi:uncharacterized membrane protein